ncbi:hypothetical protein WJX84_009212 [Apatococcus fuscideae]|uniref:Uncharacterized protein n=1 Tax=Apatococcus fuscideae TaxID=2026836 RepID=A0AAW1TLF4_9CHLO
MAMSLQAWQQQVEQQQAQLQRQAGQGGGAGSMSRHPAPMGMLSSLNAQLSQAENARRVLQSPSNAGPLSPSQFMRAPVVYGGREEQQRGSEVSPLLGWGIHQRGGAILAEGLGREQKAALVHAQEQLQQNMQRGRHPAWPPTALQPQSHADAAFQDWGMASEGEQSSQAWQQAQRAGLRHQQPLLPPLGAIPHPTPGNLLAQSLSARGGEEVGGLLPATQATHPPSATAYQPPASPAARLLSPRQMSAPHSHMQPGHGARHYNPAEGFTRPTPIRTRPMGTHSMGSAGGSQRQLEHDGSHGKSAPLGFASPQRSGVSSQGRPPASHLPGSPFDGNIEGHDDFSVLGSRFPVPGSPHGTHGFEGLWSGGNRAQPQMFHHHQQQYQQQQQQPQQQQARQPAPEPPSFSPQKRQRQSAPGQALLPMDDFGLGDWVASDLGVDDMIMNSIGQAGWNPGLLDGALPGGGAAEADAVLGGQTGQQPPRSSARPPLRPPAAGCKPAAKSRKRGKGADRKGSAGEKRKASLEESIGAAEGEGATAAAEETEEVIEYFVAGQLNQGSPTLLPPPPGGRCWPASANKTVEVVQELSSDAI